WTEATDPSGRVFYFNQNTAESAWDRPVGKVAEESPSLPSDWVETLDPTSGKTYYYNEATNETTWDKPAVE
ncbi:predicted protein, partial [Thalassiosira pseudonana CCMP1335]